MKYIVIPARLVNNPMAKISNLDVIIGGGLSFYGLGSKLRGFERAF
jgi:hypothetical protein